jgi:hypothetical protein
MSAMAMLQQLRHILVTDENGGLRKGTTMRRPHLLISAAWLLQGIAWFLPVVTSIGGGKIDPITGWQAFLMASSAAWPGGLDSSPWYVMILTILSVVTTLFFIVGSPWVVSRGTRSQRRASAWAAATAFLVNSHWYVRLTHDGWVSDLGIGYFLWWCSFILLAIGLFDLAGRNDAAEFTHGQATPLPR